MSWWGLPHNTLQDIIDLQHRHSTSCHRRLHNGIYAHEGFNFNNSHIEVVCLQDLVDWRVQFDFHVSMQGALQNDWAEIGGSCNRAHAASNHVVDLRKVPRFRLKTSWVCSQAQRKDGTHTHTHAHDSDWGEWLDLRNHWGSSLLRKVILSGAVLWPGVMWTLRLTDVPPLEKTEGSRAFRMLSTQAEPFCTLGGRWQAHFCVEFDTLI